MEILTTFSQITVRPLLIRARELAAKLRESTGKLVGIVWHRTPDGARRQVEELTHAVAAVEKNPHLFQSPATARSTEQGELNSRMLARAASSDMANPDVRQAKILKAMGVGPFKEPATATILSPSATPAPSDAVARELSALRSEVTALRSAAASTPRPAVLLPSEKYEARLQKAFEVTFPEGGDQSLDRAERWFYCYGFSDVISANLPNFPKSKLQSQVGEPYKITGLEKAINSKRMERLEVFFKTA